MARRLTANVLLRQPGSRQLVTLEAGTEAPDWAVPLITNPAVLDAGTPGDASEGEASEEGDDADDGPDGPAPPSRGRARRQR